jgi:transposase InsO family protein
LCCDRPWTKVAKAVQEWIAIVGAKTAYIERGSPWENGYIESFNARLRDELLDAWVQAASTGGIDHQQKSERAGPHATSGR